MAGEGPVVSGIPPRGGLKNTKVIPEQPVNFESRGVSQRMSGMRKGVNPGRKKKGVVGPRS